jgi:hypothetical protein
MKTGAKPGQGKREKSKTVRIDIIKDHFKMKYNRLCMIVKGTL